MRENEAGVAPKRGDWTMAEVKRLLDMQADGLPLADIGQRLGRSRASINGQLQRLRERATDPGAIARYPLADIPHAHPVVRDLFARARKQGHTYDTLAKAAGMGRGKVRAIGWAEPDLKTVEQLARAVGGRLVLVSEENAHGI